MEYKQVGQSGLRISELSFGSWETFSHSIGIESAKSCMHRAFDHGINFFDTAEAYAAGNAEEIMGQVLKDFRREEYVVSTKIFWGGPTPNETGLSRKHLIEGTRNSLKRLQIDYVDLLYCHRPDPNTPIEETVRAINFCINQGDALYWGTSEWSSAEITKAFEVCDRLHLIKPIVEQPEYNLFRREKVEHELVPIFNKFGIGTTTWSPLSAGLLSGKYNHGIPAGSRVDQFPGLKKQFAQRQWPYTEENLKKVRRLSGLADQLGCTTAQLAVAWCLKNKWVTSVILGARTPDQIDENIKALDMRCLLTEPVMQTIENIMA